MKFRQQADQGKIPQVDLIPMLTVMIGILAFFVVVTMTLSAEKVMDVSLPPKGDEDAETEVTAAQLKDLFIVQIDQTGQITLNQEPVAKEPLKARIEAFLAEDDDRTVYILPDQDLPYEEVLVFLGEMRAVGGDRVSLAIEASDTPPNEASESEGE